MKKNQLNKVIMLFVGIVIVVFTASGSDAYTSAQKRLMAKRAAKVDALRNLAETIYGVRIDSSTTVRDFVTQSDTVRARLSAAIQGAKEVDYVEHPDGTAEVTLEITVGRVEDILGRRLYYDHKTFQATGYGAPPGESVSTPDSNPEPSVNRTIQAKGYGAEPNDPYMNSAQKRLMAKRAAKVDALRNLAEEVYGIKITSDSYVKDFVTQSDEIRSRVRACIQGARVVSEKQMPDGTYETIVEIDLASVRSAIGIR